MVETLVQKYQRLLGISEEEALALIEEDKRIDKMTMKELNADLTKEQQQAMKKARQSERKPTVYNFTKRERKENPTKANIIAELYNFLSQDSENAVKNCEISNKERQIIFQIGENTYELTLVQKRKPKN